MSEASWRRFLKGDPTGFMLDELEPGLVWRALISLYGRPHDSSAVIRSREAARGIGAAAGVLARQSSMGYWGSPMAYGARWGGTAWNVMALARLGADPEDPRVALGAETLLEQLQPQKGGFATVRKRPPSPCFTAELCAAFARLGFAHHPRVREAIAWLAERQGGVGGWGCPDLTHLIEGACPVTAVSCLRLVAEHPGEDRPQLFKLAERAAGWLLERNLFVNGRAPRGWGRFCHPNLGGTDLLDATVQLARLDWPANSTISNALLTLLSHQDGLGRWCQERACAFGEGEGQPSRWVTLKALIVISTYGESLNRLG